MLKKLGYIAVLSFILVACDNLASGFVREFGTDFQRAFDQSPNDTPLDPTGFNLVLTPLVDPFNI